MLRDDVSHRASLYVRKLDVEQERRIGRDRSIAGSTRTIRKVGRNHEPAQPTDAHAGNTLIPSTNHPSHPKGERDRVRVELPSLVLRRGRRVQPARVVDGDVPASYCFSAGADAQIGL